MGFLFGGGGLLLLGAGVCTGGCASGAATSLVDKISPSTGCPSTMVTSCVYGFPAASTLLTVALVTVSPPGGATTVLDAIVTVPFRLLARWVTSGPSTLRASGFHVRTAKPRVPSSSSSFFSSFSGGPSTSGSSSSRGSGRL